MGTGSLSQEVRRPGRGIEHPPSSSAKVEARVEICLYCPSGLSWPGIGKRLGCKINTNNNINNNNNNSNNFIVVLFKANETEGQKIHVNSFHIFTD